MKVRKIKRRVWRLMWPAALEFGMCRRAIAETLGCSPLEVEQDRGCWWWEPGQ